MVLLSIEIKNSPSHHTDEAMAIPVKDMDIKDTTVAHSFTAHLSLTPDTFSIFTSRPLALRVNRRRPTEASNRRTDEGHHVLHH